MKPTIVQREVFSEDGFLACPELGSGRRRMLSLGAMVTKGRLPHGRMSRYVHTPSSMTAQRDAVNLVEGQLFPNVPKFESRENTATEGTQLIR